MTGQNFSPGTCLAPTEYKQAIGILREFTRFALLWLTEKTPDELKDQIIGNFIARGMVCLDSIYRLWEVGNYADSWILHRALVERLFLVCHLIDHNEFVEFEQWSFQKQHKMASDALSNQEIRRKLTPELLKQARTLQQQGRSRLKREPQSTWTRPSAEDVAKQVNLPLFYQAAYDIASTKVHPMADDGKNDFSVLTGLGLESNEDELIVVHNSFLIQVALVNRGFGACSVLWRGFVSDFCDQLLSLLETGSPEYLETYQKAAMCGPHYSWCEPRENGFNVTK